MGLFDQLLGGIVGQLGTSQQKNSLMELATSVIQNQPGGLGGLLQQFKSAGLGEHADSWVGTGANKTVSADQVSSALGSSNIAAMAQKLGINPQTASAGLAALLPVIIDQMTPKGQVDHGADLGTTLAALKAKMMA
ncbi:MAG TPA: YidB family protein, partial [Thermoanaerobaculia bacterium]|jgi:uncharacterized protein YidB (DUF937 family)|nr:YidB family protein [Thermoanaerobaculia bacterium]